MLTDEQWKDCEAAAWTYGLDCGKGAASWLLDGNSSTDDALALLREIEDGTMNYPEPLSGEWADGLMESAVLAEIVSLAGVDEVNDDESDDLIRLFLDAYSEGYGNEAQRAASAMLR